jgi:predicted nucleic acid-binding protein
MHACSVYFRYANDRGTFGQSPGTALLPFDERAAERAAAIRQHLDGAGTPIGMADYLIAGICLANSAMLLTRNRKHFERVTGLVLG